MRKVDKNHITSLIDNFFKLVVGMKSPSARMIVVMFFVAGGFMYYGAKINSQNLVNVSYALVGGLILMVGHIFFDTQGGIARLEKYFDKNLILIKGVYKDNVADLKKGYDTSVKDLKRDHKYVIDKVYKPAIESKYTATGTVAGKSPNPSVQGNDFIPLEDRSEETVS